jgi:hypothetical protein
MRKGLINLLIVLAAAAIAFNVGLRAAGPLWVVCGGTQTSFDQGAAGAINGDEGSCELAWVICWRRT